MVQHTANMLNVPIMVQLAANMLIVPLVVQHTTNVATSVRPRPQLLFRPPYGTPYVSVHSLLCQSSNLILLLSMILIDDLSSV